MSPKYNKSKVQRTALDILKKYEPRYSSTKLLLQVNCPGFQETDLRTPQSHKKSLKIAVDRSSEIPRLNSSLHSISRQSPAHLKNRPRKIDHFSPEPIFLPTELTESKTPVVGNRLGRIARLSKSPIMQSFDKLVTSCSQTLLNKQQNFLKERKKIIKISKNIRSITKDPDDKIPE